MLITIRVSQNTAIKMLRNSTEWTTEIDVTTLTTEQREHLSAHTYNPETLCDKSGEITVESIQAHIDQESEIDRRKKAEYDAKMNRIISDMTARIIAYENGGERPDSGWGEIPLGHPLRNRIGGEDQRRIEAWEAAIAPEVAAYLAGGERVFTAWKGAWAGKKDTFEAIRAEDKRRELDRRLALELIEAETDKRKLAQLAAAVARLGTDVQREKWGVGLMAREEALQLIWAETFPGNPLPADEYHIEKPEYGKRYENEKGTLTDEQYVAAKSIIASVPDSKAAYFHQYTNSDEENYTCDVLRLTKTVGEYTLDADYII